MPILITGATGLVGANLARLLCVRGEKPRLLVRERSDRRGLRGLDCEEILGDVLRPDTLAPALEGVDRVYHCAGGVRPDKVAPAELERLNVDGTRNVVRAARAAGVRRVVHVSSVSAVGHGPLDHPATEDMAWNFDERLVYHRSKRRAEEAARAEAGGSMELVIGNPTIVIGASDVRPTSGELILAVARGRMPFFPSGGTNFVNASDVAEGLSLLMDRGRSGERYILGGENLTWRAFFDLVAEEAGARPPKIPVPDRVLHGLASVGHLVERIAPPLARYVQLGYLAPSTMAAYYSIAKAERELGYRPRPLRLGVRDALRWFQEEGVLPRDVPLHPRGTVPV